MKNFILTFLLLLSLQLTAQNDIFSKSGISLKSGNDMGYAMLNKVAFDKNKEQIVVNDQNLYLSNYKGTPMLMKQWSEGIVFFNDGKKIAYPNINYDALSDHFIIYFKNLAKDIKGVASTQLPIASLQDQSVLYLQMFDGNKQRKFIKLNPVLFVRKPKTLFFEYFSNDWQKVYIVKSYWKNVQKNQDVNSPLYNETASMKLMQHSAYYIKNKDGIFEKVRLKKKSILKTLNDKQAEKTLMDFAKRNRLSWSKPQDVQKILAYYFENITRK